MSTCGTPQTLPVWNHRKHASFLEVALCKTQALSSSLHILASMSSEVAHTGDANTRWTKDESLAPARLPSRTAVVQHNIRDRHDAVLVQRGDARAQLRLAAIRRGKHFVVARQVALPNTALGTECLMLLAAMCLACNAVQLMTAIFGGESWSYGHMYPLSVIMCRPVWQGGGPLQ